MLVSFRFQHTRPFQSCNQVTRKHWTTLEPKYLFVIFSGRTACSRTAVTPLTVRYVQGEGIPLDKLLNSQVSVAPLSFSSGLKDKKKNKKMRGLNTKTEDTSVF